MTLSNTEKTLLLETVRDAARREIMPRFRALSDADISARSGPDDLVTAADLAAEALKVDGHREPELGGNDHDNSQGKIGNDHDNTGRSS